MLSNAEALFRRLLIAAVGLSFVTSCFGAGAQLGSRLAFANYGQRPDGRLNGQSKFASYLQVSAKTKEKGIMGNIAGNVLTASAAAVLPNGCVAETLTIGKVTQVIPGGEDDYPYQTACHMKNVENELSCFPGESQVLTPSGYQALATISLGDMVATKVNDSGAVFEPVMYFLHRDPAKTADVWVVISYDSPTSRAVAETRKLVASKNHLVTVCSTADESSCEMKPSRLVAVDDYMKAPRKAGYSFDRVVDVKLLSSYEAKREGIFGLYAPVTESGTLIVDGHLVSSFSTIFQTQDMWSDAWHSICAFVNKKGVQTARWLGTVLNPLPGADPFAPWILADKQTCPTGQALPAAAFKYI